MTTPPRLCAAVVPQDGATPPPGGSAYRHLPFGRQRPEQHWLLLVHVAPVAPQQFGSFPELQLGPQQPSLRPHAGHVYTQPVAGLQVSVVQLTPSLQEMAVKTQPVALSHESSVQSFPSLQTRGAPAQTPPEQTSPTVQASTS